MKIITSEQSKEYESLKRRYHMDLYRDSIRSLSLEQDIDEPVKSCVMAFGLLGCNPMWSCCGFDYEGQPIHKAHHYGWVYFALTLNPVTKTFINIFLKTPNWFFADTWKVNLTFNDGVKTVWFQNPFIQIKDWDDEECINYSEIAATRIRYLEYFFATLKDNMADSFTLIDQNAKYKRRFPFWQYPTKEPWTFAKEDLMKRIRG